MGGESNSSRLPLLSHCEKVDPLSTKGRKRNGAAGCRPEDDDPPYAEPFNTGKHTAPVNLECAIEGACKMAYKWEIACKWATCGIWLAVFFSLVSLAGCINIVEFIGSIMVAIMAAHLFYTGICSNYSDRLAHQ